MRIIFDAIERVAQIAASKRLTGVMLDYNFDVLSAVPIERIENSAFQTKRWPRIMQTVDEQRRKCQRLRARRGKPTRA